MMMDRIRGAAQHILFKILLGVIILSFILSGGFYYIAAAPTYAVKVNGDEVSLQEFNDLFQNRSYLLPDDADNEAIDTLKEEVLKSVIDKLLIEQFVKSLDVTISNDQIKMLIAQNPMFLNESGQFDTQKYEAFLNERFLTGDQLAEYIRTKELTPLILQELNNTVFTLPSEIDDYGKLFLQKRTIRTAPIDLKVFTEKQSVTDEELKQFYEENEIKYTLPEAIKLSYVMIDRTDFLNRIDANEEAVKTYYQSFLADKNFAIIQVASKADAEKILEELNAGADFATLAKERSLDIGTKASGGELGMMSVQDLPDAFAELKTQNLKEKGQLSSVIPFNEQFIVAKLVDIDDSMPEVGTPEYQSLVTQMKAEKSTDLFFEAQQKVSDILTGDSPSLDEIVKVANLTIMTTELFDRENIPEPLNFEPILVDAFNSDFIEKAGQPDAFSELITLSDDKVVVLRIDEHREKTLQKFDEIKEQVTADLKLKKSEDELNTLTAQAITDLENKKEGALNALKTEFKNQEVITADSDKPEYRQDVEYLKAIFALPLPKEGESTYQSITKQNGERVIVAFDDIEYPTPSEEEYKDFEARLNNLKARQFSESLLKKLKAGAEIEYGDIGLDTSAL
ncbi:SurA N-terminal domain-containing protein [Thorsellia kenyensis]|uniref:Periplasmic chaperone PpiD n=1 Tax=Thorsellia kenyensis TaxID=1549888 RepID=A0ABV6C9N5_9GAMM